MTCFSDTQAALVHAMRAMPVIDTHEHLSHEADVLSQPADLFSRCICHYSLTNAQSAGFPLDRDLMHSNALTIEEKWQRFAPYHFAIQQTGYYRAALYTARELFGVTSIHEHNYKEVSEQFTALNKPGLYRTLLRDRCRIETVINQGFPLLEEEGGPEYVDRSLLWMGGPHSPTAQTAADVFRELPRKPETLDEFVQMALAPVLAANSKGVKFYATFYQEDPCVPKAEQALAQLHRTGTLTGEELHDLTNVLLHKTMDACAVLGLIVCIHCGISWDCWNDVNNMHPGNVTKIALMHRDTRFDLYHGGYPFMGEIGTIANQCPNVYLNLVWLHQISPFAAVETMNQWMDVVPLNKILAFGGDNVMPEKTVGALALARENMAAALAKRVEAGFLSEKDAETVCRMWLYDNPKQLYRL